MLTLTGFSSCAYPVSARPVSLKTARMNNGSPCGPLYSCGSCRPEIQRQHAEMGGCHFWMKCLRPGSQGPWKPKTCHPRCSLVKREQSRLCLQNPRQHNPSQESGLACMKKESPQIQLQAQACQPALYRHTQSTSHTWGLHISSSSQGRM